MSSDEIVERSFTIGLLGANHEITKLIGDSLGKAGTKSDLQFFNRLDSQLKMVFTAIAPISYPDKIKSLLQTCVLNQIHIMIIDAETGITPEIGEIMVVMDIFASKFGTKYVAAIGNITSGNEWRIEEIEKQLPKLVANTTIKDIQIFSLREKNDYQKLKEQIAELGKSIPKESVDEAPYAKMLIDHAFPVKGVGTVVLGIIKQGQFKAGDMYDLIPIQKKVILRSIQKQDRDFKTAEAGDRVGLALKGLKSEMIDRNAIFCSLGAITTSDKFQARISVSPYYRPQNQEGVISPKNIKNYHLIADLGITPIKLLEGDEIKPGQTGTIELKLEKGLPHDKNGLKGIIADFGPFEKKLRIVGYFEQILKK